MNFNLTALGGRGGVPGSKSDFCSFSHILLIHDIGSLELFTELKNIDFWPRTVFPKLGHIARCREMYRISHIVEFGLKIQGGDSFLGAG